MKYQAVTHTKMIRLGRVYGSKPLAVGVVESVIALILTEAPRGDIGKLSDQEIELWVGWTGEPGAMIAGLIECGWLDECIYHRLILHDWPDHAPSYVHKRAADADKLKKYPEPFFVTPSKPINRSDTKNGDSSEMTQCALEDKYTVLPVSPVLSCPVLSVIPNRKPNPEPPITLSERKAALAATISTIKPKAAM